MHLLIQYQFPVNDLPPVVEIARGFAMSFPIDWRQQVLDNGPLPVVIFLHGGNQQPVAFMADTFRIKKWWDGSWAGASPVPLKAIALGPQGVTLDSDLGGDWNAGNMGAINRMDPVDDVAFIVDMLERAELRLVTAYNKEPPNADAPVLEMGDFFDGENLFIVGFSEGGQMAYRLADRLRLLGFKVAGLAIFGSSIGGWRRETDRMANPADVDWTPVVGQLNPTVANLRVGSLLHVHGARDDHVNPIADGPSRATMDVAEAQVEPPGDPEAFERSDISGLKSALAYEAVLNAALGPGVPTAFPAAIPAAQPAGTRLPDSFATDWTVGADSKQVVFAHIDGLAHVVPAWGYQAVIQFFQRVGSL